MKHIYNDGGRKAAGYKGRAGDCVVRSIAIAAELPYRQVYEALSAGTCSQRHTKHGGPRPSARNGVNTRRQWFKNYMASLGWKWTATMGIGTGCRVHLNASELPGGRLIVAVSKHYTAVIDGVIHDTFDPTDRGVTIFPPNYLGNIPVGARRLENGNGWAYAPERCVYGYWSKAA